MKELEFNRKNLLSKCFQLNFYYQDPHSNFDRSKVKGKVFMLFRAKEKIHEKALEIGAGGRLYNIVVENEVVSKQLIERESFGKNVTIIPNNKIRFKAVSQDTISFASKVAKEVGGLARPAYELISYSRDIENSMMYVFSNFVVCSNSEIAQRIAYNHQRHLACRCVTYDGDIYEQGTLSGGYISQAGMILPQYNELCQFDDAIKKERAGFEAHKQKYENYQRASNEFRNKQK
jgi:structural maintenance of chromosome 2